MFNEFWCKWNYKTAKFPQWWILISKLWHNGLRRCIRIWKFCTIVEVYTTSKKLVRSRVSMQFYGTITFHDRSHDLLWWLSRRMWKENNGRNYYVKYYSEITRLPDVINDLPSYLFTEVSINLVCFRQRSLRQVFSDIYSLLNAFFWTSIKASINEESFSP